MCNNITQGDGTVTPHSPLRQKFKSYANGVIVRAIVYLTLDCG